MFENSDEKLYKKLTVKRIGNVKNPKLVILLENIASKRDYMKHHSEYVMMKDHKYGDGSGGVAEGKSIMSFNDVIEYDNWWLTLSEIWKRKFQNDEVLALEYYPYATDENKEKEIKKYSKTADKYVLDAMTENKEILKKAINSNAHIFVYYKSKWFEKDYCKEILEKYFNNYDNEYAQIGKCQRPNCIRNRFVEFIKKISIVN